MLVIALVSREKITKVARRDHDIVGSKGQANYIGCKQSIPIKSSTTSNASAFVSDIDNIGCCTSIRALETRYIVISTSVASH